MSKAVIPAEAGIVSYRVAHRDNGKDEEKIYLHLDLLDEVRMPAEQRMTRYQDLMAKHYYASLDTSASGTLS